MVSIARKNLFSDKTRLIVSISGVAFSILLITFLLGVYNAFATLATVYLNNSGADIIVAQEGVTDMFHTFSSLGNEKISQVERVSGGKAYGLISKTTNVFITEEDGTKIIDFSGRKKGDNIKGKKKTMNIIGFDTKSGLGGPWILKEGSITPKDKQIVVDQVFSKQTGLGLYDQIEMFGEVFTISGVTDKNNILIYTRGFIDLNEAQELLNEKGTVNFILLKLKDPTQVSETIKKLEDEIVGIEAYEKAEFARSSGKMITDSFIPVLLVITVIGFLTGAVIVGITIYTSTVEKIKEYGILKAIGASNKKLFLIVFEQAFWSSITGYFIGIILLIIVKAIVVRFIPVMAVEPTPQHYIFAFVTSFLISVLASYIPIRKISGLDPAMVFKR